MDCLHGRVQPLCAGSQPGCLGCPPARLIDPKVKEGIAQASSSGDAGKSGGQVVAAVRRFR
eukprot:10906203-Lingulodinium_polyedra.AAC.1